MNAYLIPLSHPQATLENVGGKGMSPAKMIGAGFPVPNGFHVSTEAYRAFVDANNLQKKILAALKDVDTTIPVSLETASTSIRRFFADSAMPDGIAHAIKDAYLTLDTSHLTLPVAVRSSALRHGLRHRHRPGRTAQPQFHRGARVWHPCRGVDGHRHSPDP